jgi:hypothetical protein
MRELARPDGTGFFQLFLILLREADPALTEADAKALVADEPEQVADLMDLIRTEVEARLADLEKKAFSGPAGNSPGPRSTSPASTPGSPGPRMPAAKDSAGPTPPG